MNGCVDARCGPKRRVDLGGNWSTRPDSRILKQLEAAIDDLALQVGEPPLAQGDREVVNVTCQKPAGAVVQEHACAVGVGGALDEFEAAVLLVMRGLPKAVRWLT